MTLLELAVHGHAGNVATRRVQVAVRAQSRRDGMAQSGCSFGESEHVDIGAAHRGLHQGGQFVAGGDDDVRIDGYVFAEHRRDQQVGAARVATQTGQHQLCCRPGRRRTGVGEHDSVGRIRVHRCASAVSRSTNVIPSLVTPNALARTTVCFAQLRCGPSSFILLR